MSNWEIFTWITVVILGLGSVVVFILFLKDIKEILKKFNKEEKRRYKIILIINGYMQTQVKHLKLKIHLLKK